MRNTAATKVKMSGSENNRVNRTTKYDTFPP